MAEVTSRLDVKKFCQAVERLGFKVNKIENGSYFVTMEFLKENKSRGPLPDSSLLAPCMYRKR